MNYNFLFNIDANFYEQITYPSLQRNTIYCTCIGCVKCGAYTNLKYHHNDNTFCNDEMFCTYCKTQKTLNDKQTIHKKIKNNTSYEPDNVILLMIVVLKWIVCFLLLPLTIPFYFMTLHRDISRLLINDVSYQIVLLPYQDWFDINYDGTLRICPTYMVYNSKMIIDLTNIYKTIKSTNQIVYYFVYQKILYNMKINRIKLFHSIVMLLFVLMFGFGINYFQFVKNSPKLYGMLMINMFIFVMKHNKNLFYSVILLLSTIGSFCSIILIYWNSMMEYMLINQNYLINEMVYRIAYPILYHNSSIDTMINIRMISRFKLLLHILMIVPKYLYNIPMILFQAFLSFIVGYQKASKIANHGRTLSHFLYNV